MGDALEQYHLLHGTHQPMPFSSTGWLRQSTILPLSVVRRGTSAGADGAVAALKLLSNMQPVITGKVKSGSTVLHGMPWTGKNLQRHPCAPRLAVSIATLA